MNIRERELEILEQATDDQRVFLAIDRNYGSPQSFWASARAYGLVTESEYERARLHYRDLWYYRGD